MGVWDEVCGVHIKCTPNCNFEHYNIGDIISLESGLYIGYNGWFVVKNNIVKISGKSIYSKWGDSITTNKILDQYNPILKL